MKDAIKEVKEVFITNPMVAFIVVTLFAVWFLYSDLSMFIIEQQKILTEQVKQQQQTTDLLKQISDRIREIELRIYDKNYTAPIYDKNYTAPKVDK